MYVCIVCVHVNVYVYVNVYYVYMHMCNYMIVLFLRLSELNFFVVADIHLCCANHTYMCIH